MNTQSMPALAQALAGSLPDSAVRALMQALGNCQQPVQSRATNSFSPSYTTGSDGLVRNGTWNPSAVPSSYLPTASQVGENYYGPSVGDYIANFQFYADIPQPPGFSTAPFTQNFYEGAQFSFPMSQQFSITNAFPAPTNYFGGSTYMENVAGDTINVRNVMAETLTLGGTTFFGGDFFGEIFQGTGGFTGGGFGLPGSPGANGRDGLDGMSLAGAAGAPGRPGVGSAGRTGRGGRAGTNGRDGLDGTTTVIGDGGGGGGAGGAGSTLIPKTYSVLNDVAVEHYEVREKISTATDVSQTTVDLPDSYALSSATAPVNPTSPDTTVNIPDGVSLSGTSGSAAGGTASLVASETVSIPSSIKSATLSQSGSTITPVYVPSAASITYVSDVSCNADGTLSVTKSTLSFSQTGTAATAERTISLSTTTNAARTAAKAAAQVDLSGVTFSISGLTAALTASGAVKAVASVSAREADLSGVKVSPQTTQAVVTAVSLESQETLVMTDAFLNVVTETEFVTGVSAG